MQRAQKASVFALLLVMMLAFALFAATPVHAEAEAPTNDPAPVDVSAPPADAQPADPVEEPQAPAGTEEPAPADPAAEALSDPTVEAPPEPEAETPPADDLAELPAALAENDVQLVDGQGDPLSLASQSTAEAVKVSDPYFYVGTTKYTFTTVDCDPGTPGDQACEDGKNPIQAALDYIRAKGLVPSNRMIYVEGDTYEGDVVLDANGTLEGNLPSSALSQIKGLIGVVNPLTSVATPTLNGWMSVYGTASGFTLSNFVVNGKILFDGNVGALNITDVTQGGMDTTGLKIVNHNGAVTLTRVKTSGNSGNGTEIDNTAGTGNVSISESVFENNGIGATGDSMYAGLVVNTNGTATLNGISASGNNGDGAVVWNFKGLTVRNSLFNDNRRGEPLLFSGYGFQANSSLAANITLDTVTANNNVYDGIQLITYGSVTGKNLTTENNREGGSGLMICGITDGYDNCNEARALNVSLTNITSTNNYGTGVGIAARGTVTINTGFSGWNGADGFFINSIGNVTLNGVGAEGNAYGRGIYVSTADLAGAKGSVTFLNKLGNNSFNNNQLGLEIRSKGAISLTGVGAFGNDYFGARLDNTFGTAGVTINNASFGDNDWFGGEIHTNGAVILKNSDMNNNGQDLSDLPTDTHGGGLYIYNNTAVKPAPVSITWSWFSNNKGGDGLFVDSKGHITLVDVFANDNPDGMGANLHNEGLGGTGNIVVKVSSVSDGREMSRNGNMGLYAVSNGTITVQNMSFRENADDGANLDNYGGLYKAVTVKDVDFNDNNNGLYVLSKGAVTITNITSSRNRGHGVYVDNQGGAGAVKISRTAKEGHNYLGDNGESGTRIYANGAVTLDKVIANNNGGAGAYIDNCNAQYDSNGQLMCAVKGGSVSVAAPSGWMTEFKNNVEDGLFVMSPGAITVVNVNASDNGWGEDSSGNGMRLWNDFVGVSSGVTVKTAGSSWNEANNNNGDGLFVTSYGVISVTTLNANRNNGYGAYLSNPNQAAPKAVSLTNAGFHDNFNGDGLFVGTYGAVKLTNVAGDRNDFTDGWLYYDSNNKVGVKEQIKDYGNAGEMIDYWRFGAQESGSVRFNLSSIDFAPKLTLYVWNENPGVWDEVASATDESDSDRVEFYYDLVQGKIYRLAASSPDADQSGNYVLGIGAAAPKTNNGNGANGLEVYAYGSGSTVTVKNPVNQTAFNENASTGVFIMARNAITLSDVHADRNGNNGVYASNTGGTGGVTINGWSNSFNENWNQGMTIFTNGVISLANTDAGRNGQTGVWLDNSYGTADVKITTTRANFGNGFWENGGDGLRIDTRGNVLLNNVNAGGNGWGGAFIANADTATVSKTLKITNSYFGDNLSDDGLNINFYGAVILDLVNANNNQSSSDEIGNGIYINNTINNLVQNVTVTRSSFTGNHWHGLQINTNGKVILDGLFGMNNGQDGVYVNNQTAVGTGTVTLTNKKGANTFINNGGYGLNVASNKAIMVSGVEVKYNGIGIKLVSSGGPVSLSNALVRDNRGPGGIYMETHGFDATVSNVQSFMNGLTYHGSGLTAVVTGANLRLTNSTFYGNGQYGVDADLDSLARLIQTGTLCFANGRDDGAPNYNLPVL